MMTLGCDELGVSWSSDVIFVTGALGKLSPQLKTRLSQKLVKSERRYERKYVNKELICYGIFCMKPQINLSVLLYV